MQAIGEVFNNARRHAAAVDKDCRLLRGCLENPAEAAEIFPGNNVLSCLAEVTADVQALRQSAEEVQQTPLLSALVQACCAAERRNSQRLDAVESYFEQYGYTRPPPPPEPVAVVPIADARAAERELLQAEIVPASLLVRENTFTADAVESTNEDEGTYEGADVVAEPAPLTEAVDSFDSEESPALCDGEAVGREETAPTLDDTLNASGIGEGVAVTTEETDALIRAAAPPKGALEAFLSDDEDDDDFDFVSLQELGISTATLSILQQGEPLAPRTPNVKAKRRPLAEPAATVAAAGADADDSFDPDFTLHGITSVQVLPPTPMVAVKSAAVIAAPPGSMPRPAALGGSAMVAMPTPSRNIVHAGDVFAPVTEAEYGSLPRFISVTLALEDLNMAIKDIEECVMATDAPPSEVIFTQAQLRDDLALDAKAKPVLLVLLKLQRLESRGRGDDGEPLYSFKISA